MSIPNPKLGAPPVADRVAVRLEDLRVRLVVDAAGRERDLVDALTVSSSDASTGGVGADSPSIEMSGPSPWTTASVPRTTA